MSFLVNLFRLVLSHLLEKQQAESVLAATPFDQLLTTQFVDDLSVVKGGPNDALRVGDEGDDDFVFLAGVGGETLSAPRPFNGTETFLPGDTHVIVGVTQVATLANALEAELSRPDGVAVQPGPNGEPGIYIPPGIGAFSPSNGATVSSDLRAIGSIRPLHTEPVAPQLDASLAATITAGYVRESASIGAARKKNWRPS